MAFPAEILRSGVKIANTLTKGAQSTVTIEAWVGQDGKGTRQYANPVQVQAVVDLTRKQRPGPTGQLVDIIATITIVGDLAPNGTTGTTPPRVEPIDPKDRVTLPDGTTGPIVSAPNAVVDPGTSRGFIHEIMLGAV